MYLGKNYTTWAELWFEEFHEIIAIEVKAGTPPINGNPRHLQSSIRGHAGGRKVGSPEKLFGKNYEAPHNWM